MSDKNKIMLARAKKFIPGVSQLLSKRPDMFSLGVWPTYFSKAKGSYIWDLNDQRYLDMSIGGIGANVLGYSDPDVTGKVVEAIELGSSCSLNCSEDIELAELLCKLHPWASSARFARTGGEAMAVAVRIARAHTGKDKVAFCGYHGWHDWYLAANLTDKSSLNEHLISGLKPAGVPQQLKGTSLPFRYNQIDDLKAIFADNKNEVGVVVLEPIRNIPPEDNFLSKVRELAHQNGALVIFDEISAGFRICDGGSHLTLGCIPDIAVFSKAIGNGHPIAAIIGTKAAMESSQESFISSTYWTERVGATAAIATINKFITNNVAEHLQEIGKKVQQGWKDCAKKHDLKISISGIYPLSHFSFENDHNVLKAYFIQRMLEAGILASNSFYPMYSHTVEQVEEYLNHVDTIFQELSKLDETAVAKRLQGHPSSSGFHRLN